MARSVDPENGLSLAWEQIKASLEKDDLTELNQLGRLLNPQNSSVSLSFPDQDKATRKEIDFKAVSEEWKHEAFYYYEHMPEVNKVVNVTARSVSACDLEIGWQRPEGTLQALQEDPELNRILRELEGPGGDYKQILESIATNMQISGDGFLIADPIYKNPENPDSGISGYQNWEFVSIEELGSFKKNSEGETTFERNSTGGQSKMNFFSLERDSNKTMNVDTYLARCWRRSPRYSQLSISALKPNLKLCKLITKLDDVIEAVANSQLPGGILIIPEESSFGPADETIDPGEAAEDQGDPLSEEILDFLSEAVDDRSSSASLSPILMRLGLEPAKGVQFIRLSRDMDVQTSVVRQELHERLAMGLDAPRETLEGKGQSNNWSGFLVDANFASHHVIPLGYMIADFLTRCYLWPILEKRIKDGLSNKSLDEVKRYRFIFNPKNIVARVDKATLALKLFERGILGEKATALAAGFELQDLKSTDERRQSLIIDLFKASPVTLAPILLPLIDGLEHLEDLLPIPDETGRIREGDKPVLQDSDGRGPSLPRQTPDKEGKGQEPDPERINKNKTPGGDDEDSRNPIIEKLGLDFEDPQYLDFVNRVNLGLNETQYSESFKTDLELKLPLVIEDIYGFLGELLMESEFNLLGEEVGEFVTNLSSKYIDSFHTFKSLTKEDFPNNYMQALIEKELEEADWLF